LIEFHYDTLHILISIIAALYFFAGAYGRLPSGIQKAFLVVFPWGKGVPIFFGVAMFYQAANVFL